MAADPGQGTRQRARVFSHQFGAYVVAAATNGRLFGLCFGDGMVRLIDSENPEAKPTEVQVHAGAGLCLAADIDKGAFLSGGDANKLAVIAATGTAETLAEHKGRWIEHAAAHAGAGVRVYATGKDVYILGKQNKPPRKLAHFTSVGGLAINPKGKRLAVARYNGVSLWWLAQDSPAAELEWRGSHLQATWSPDGDYVITAMQENALHGWRLSTGEHMRMAGYPAKVRSISFTRRGHYLASGGSERVVCWPFIGGGPMGKAPFEFGGAGGEPVTAVASNPALDVIAAGFADGTLIVGQPGPNEGAAKLILMGKGAPITALCWNPDGDRLLAGTESGDVHIADFRA